MRSLIAGTFLAAAVVVVGTPAAAQPAIDQSTVLQVPGVVVAWPITGGAAVVNPTVRHGHGYIDPGPSYGGWVFTWTNLSTGTSGTVAEHTPRPVFTGAGQLVVTAQYRIPQAPFGIPSVGTFYVTP